MYNTSLASIIQDDQAYLERSHVDQLLERAIQSPIVMIIAGAGYGKTYTVYSFLKRYRVLSSWLQCSKWDNYGPRFWENFVQTIGIVNKNSAARLKDIGFPETQRQFDRYIVIPDTDIIPEKKYIFVYDDFHLIHDEAVLRFMERSISSPYPNVTSILISRNEPTINTVNLLSKGMLTIITEDDLRFSQQEMLDYFQMQDITLSQADASSIYHDTEGWAFAIHLAGLSLKKGGDTRSSIKTNIFNLIEHGIFSGISEDLQKYLIKISLIEQWPLELLAELSSCQDIIEEMERIGSFVRYDTYLNTYRIHHLFVEYLNSKQDLLTDDEKREVYNKAAIWCQEHNFQVDALSYYEKAGNYQGIITLAYGMPQMMPSNIAEFILCILNRTPAEVYKENSVLYVLRSRIRLGLRRFEESLAEIEEVIATFEVLPSSRYNNRILFGMYNNWGFHSLATCMRTKRYDFAQYFQKADYYYSLEGFEISGPITNFTFGCYACRVGGREKEEMEQFIEAVSLSIPHVSKTIKGCMYGYDDMIRAEYAFLQTDLHNAEKYALTALYKSREKHQYDIENRALFFLMRISLSLGNQKQVQDILKQMQALLQMPAYLHRYIFYDIFMGWFYIHIGNFVKIPNWLKNDFEKNDMDNPFISSMEILVRIKYLLADKQYAEAVAMLENDAYQYGELWRFLIGKIMNQIVTAICFYELNEKEKAFQAFETAYHLAEPNALDMPFIESGKDIYPIIVELLKNETYCTIPQSWLEKIYRKSSAYAKKLSIALYNGNEENPKQQSLTHNLSRREMNILTGLSQGLTREEISDNMGISLNTVKLGIQSLYQKLNAVNRADAIRIATTQGLLK